MLICQHLSKSKFASQMFGSFSPGSMVDCRF
uniref:Uncharacterized protein n=1 Tax=Anguilla anguilla TaxID=7936 RepID=A0A0E9V4X0_ANGAN